MFRVAVCLLSAAVLCHAGVLSLERLDPATLEAYDRYVAAYEQNGDRDFRANRAFLIDGQPGSRRKAFRSGEPVVEILKGENVASGHIHHVYGAIHVAGVTADQVRLAMQQYPKYSIYYKPDVVEARGEPLPGGSPSDQRFRVELKLLQSTLWLDVAFDTVYNTHYLKLDGHSFETASRSVSIREYKDPHNPAAGTWDEGNDHGFIWRIDTWWHARDNGGGVDLEMTNITLTRPVPFGFGWWASRKAKASVENLMVRTRDALLASRR
ncbi:MAG TPA: hypothetical protein VG345_01615 [Bryobacteraceae bacterium]|jgi:hypothetical protein|nr:hypothetical protein [Bryobacteraceae bacterium]